MNDSHREEIAKLEALYASNPEGRVFTHLAEAYRKAGQLDRARAILDSGLERHPDYASAHVVLGRVLADAGDQAGSAAEFRRVLELDRHNLVALRSLGDLAASGGNAEEALHYYGELAVLDPSDVVIQEEIRRFRERAEESRRFRPPPEAESEAGAPAATSGANEVVADLRESAEAAGPGADMMSAGPDVAPQAAEPTGTIESGMIPSFGEALTEEQQAERGPEPGEPAAGSLEGLEVLETGVPEPEPGEETSFATITVEGMDSPEPAPEAEAEPFRPTGEPISGDVESTVVYTPIQAEAEVEEGSPGIGEFRAETSEVRGAEPDAEATPDASETPGESGWRGVDGRWEPPAPLAADEDAERERETREDTGEWISSDRWKWVAASAGEEHSQAPDADETLAAEPEAESEAAGPPDWLDGAVSSGAGPESGQTRLSHIEESPGDVEEGTTQEAGFAEPPARPVDSFEEGAADVLAASGLLDAGDIGTGDVEREQPDSGEGAFAGWDATEGMEWEEEIDDSGDLVITETLAEIYASQGLTDRAVSVYRRLVREHPRDERLRNRLAELETAMEPAAESGTAEVIGIEVEAEVDSTDDREAWVARVESAFTGGEGAAGEEETPYAWAKADRSEEAEGGRIGDYFRSLLAWRPMSPGIVSEPESLSEETGQDFSEWAGGGPEPAEPERGAESDEDLEMFRSWLKSLKK